MGLKNWFKDPSHEPPKPSEQPKQEESKEPDDGLSAKITGNAVDGYRYDIYRNNRLISYGKHVMDMKNLASVERKAQEHLTEIRQRESTELTKVIT